MFRNLTLDIDRVMFLVRGEPQAGTEAGELARVSNFDMQVLTLLQIFYLAEMGKSPEQLGQSVFIEKLTARGYEVVLLSEPIDEILVQNIRKWK